MITLASTYLGPILHYAIAQREQNVIIENKESFIKQSYRNRCEIYGANALLKLSIPLEKWANQTPIDQIRISNTENWQDQHWRSIESAYRSSPYFEFYEDELKPFYTEPHPETLIKFNAEIEQGIKSLIKASYTSIPSEKYLPTEPDYRKLIQAKNKSYLASFHFPEYIQVFGTKHGFIPNLSILDLLFNLGPASMDYLKSIDLKLQA